MKNFDKTCWAAVLAYSGVLCVSLALFLYNPNPLREGPHWNGLFQIFGPTIGSLIFVVAIVLQMCLRRISAPSGLAAILLLIGVSFLCLMLTMPMMMHV